VFKGRHVLLAIGDACTIDDGRGVITHPLCHVSLHDSDEDMDKDQNDVDQDENEVPRYLVASCLEPLAETAKARKIEELADVLDGLSREVRSSQVR
jgi:hypothetical protein